MKKAFLWAALAAVLSGRAAEAQFPQYINPGSLGLPGVGSRDSLVKAVGNAPYNIGPLRLQPVVGFRDIGYVDNILPSGARASAFTATASAGLKVYLPFGPKVTFAANAIPEYNWWYTRDDDDPDRLIENLSGLRYSSGMGLFAYFNHLTVEVTYNDSDLLQYISHEFDSPADISRRGGAVAMGVDVSNHIGLFGAVDLSEWKYDDNDFLPIGAAFPDPIEILDREELNYRVGVKYMRQSGLSLGLGYEKNNVDFSRDRRDRSNEGEGPIVTLDYLGPRFSTGVKVSDRDIVEVDNSQFRRFNAWTGDARLTWKTRGRIGVSFYGNRQLVYSITPNTSYAEQERIGAHFEIRAGWRTSLRAFAETGKDEYRLIQGDEIPRRDDFDTLGLEVQLKLRETSSLVGGVVRTDFDSNIPDFDRELTTMRLSLNLGFGGTW